MGLNKRLIGAGATASGALTPSEHFGVVLYEGDGSTSHSINGGKFGAGAYFNGSSSKVDIGSFGSVFQQNFTVSLWFNLNSLSALNNLFSSQDDYYTYILARNDTNKVQASIQIAPSTSYAINSGTITTNTWYHAVITVSSTDGFKFYMNNVLQGTESAATGNLRTMSGKSFIGAYQSADPGTFEYPTDGKIDQVRIFTKALSSSEVSTLYAETASTVESLDPLSEDTTDTLQVLGDSSCIATYQFENDETDLSGNYDGTGTAIQYAAGRYGQSASFNGSSSFINPNGDWGVNGDSSHSVSFWVNFNSSSGTQHFYGIGDTSTAYTHTSLYIDSSLGTVVHDNNGNADNLATSLGLSTGRWYHFVLVYDTAPADAIITLYIDNESKGTATRTLNVTGDAVIGRRPYYASNYLNADLDQLRIFNKAISASEVTTLYNENPLVASYRFEGNANDDTRNYDGTATNVTYEYGLGFTPDFVWIKNRSSARGHNIFDSTRGVNKVLFSNSTSDEGSETAGTSLSSFDTGGFTVGSGNGVNEDGYEMVAWCFKANGGTTSSNTDGTNIDSTVQVNADAGFSIVQFTTPGTYSASNTVGHGLGATPDMIIMKATASADNWLVYHGSLGLNKLLNLNGTSSAATLSGGTLFSTVNDTVFNPADTSSPSYPYIAYCFKSIDGFSKFGSYTGNGSDNGPIVETGFEPAFVMIKKATDDGLGGGPWQIHDNKRDLTNPRKKYLLANATNVEAADLNGIDFLSNGFQIKDDYKHYNSNGTTFIYMAFAADPDTEAPTVAKSFSTVTYTGTGATQSIEGLGFSPSLTWIKGRTNTASHQIFDTIRGATFQISSDTSGAETQNTSMLTSFDSDGVTLGGQSSVNGSGVNYVAWNWKADDNEPTIFPPNQTVADIKSTNLTLNLNLAAGSYSGSGSAIEDLSSAEEDFTVTNASVNEGYGGYYIDFDGSGDYADSDSSIATTTGNDITIEFWVRSESGSQTSYADIMDANHSTAVSGSTGEGWAIQMRATNQNSFYFVYYDGSGYQSNSDGELFTITNNEWTHIAIVKSGTSVQVYKNGSAGNSWTAGSATLANPNQKIRLAGWLAGGREFNGSLGQVRIYSDALSAGEVLGNYNATKGLFTVTESIVSANANAGFSIVKYEGTGSNTKVPHGLSAAPDMVIAKGLSGSATSWWVQHTGLSSGYVLELNSTAAQANWSSPFNNTAASSTVVTLGNGDTNRSGETQILYCFHSVSGYSKFGSYTGNGSTQSITTGFQPDFVMVKRSAGGTGNWNMFDSVRGEPMLRANTSDSEFTGLRLSFESNGFKMEDSDADRNASGSTYIYMAIKIN